MKLEQLLTELRDAEEVVVAAELAVLCAHKEKDEALRRLFDSKQELRKYFTGLEKEISDLKAITQKIER